MSKALAAFALLMILGASSAVVAQRRDAGAGASEDPDGRATSFQAVTGPTREDVPGGTLLIAAYGVAWLLVIAYVGRLALASSRTASDLARLERALGKAAPEPKQVSKGETKKES